MRNSSKYQINTAWLFSERIVRLLLSFTVGIYVARYLGPSDFGTLSYATSLVGIFAPFAMLGMDSSIVKELIKQPNSRDELLNTAFVLRIAGVLGAFICIAGVLFFSAASNEEVILVVLVALALLFNSVRVVEWHYQSIAQAKIIVQPQFIQLISSAIVKVVLVGIGASILWFAGVVLFESLILMLFLLLLARANSISLDLTGFNALQAKHLLKISWPLIGTTMAIAFYARIDQIMIKQLLGSNAVGQYAVANKILEAWYLVPALLTQSLFPALVNAKENNESLFIERASLFYALMIWLSIGASIVMLISSEIVVIGLFGDAYTEAANILKIYMWCSVFGALGISTQKVFIADNLTKSVFYRVMVGALLNITLNWLLIKYIGVLGAPIATFISLFFSVFLFDLFFDKTRRHFYYKLHAFSPFVLPALSEYLRETFMRFPK